MYICLKYDLHEFRVLHEFQSQICTNLSMVKNYPCKHFNSVCTNLSMPGYKSLSNYPFCTAFSNVPLKKSHPY